MRAEEKETSSLTLGGCRVAQLASSSASRPEHRHTSVLRSDQFPSAVHSETSGGKEWSLRDAFSLSLCPQSFYDFSNFKFA